MTDAGKRTFQILSGVRRARELLVSREPVFMAAHARLPGEILASAGADLHEIVRIATAMQRACVVAVRDGNVSAVAEDAVNAIEVVHREA